MERRTLGLKSAHPFYSTHHPFKKSSHVRAAGAIFLLETNASWDAAPFRSTTPDGSELPNDSLCGSAGPQRSCVAIMHVEIRQ